MQHIDIVGQLEASMGKLGPSAGKAVAAAIHSRILACSSTEVMTFTTKGGKIFVPAFSIDYAKALWCFMWKKKLDGEDLDSKVSAVALQAAEAEFVQFMKGKQVADSLSEPILALNLGEISNTEGRKSLNESRAFLQKELAAALGLHGGHGLTSNLTSLVADQAANFFHTASGRAVTSAFVKFASTAKGQIVLAHMVNTSVLHITTSASAKAFLWKLLSHYGLTAFIKQLILPLLGMMFPKLAAMHIPVWPVVIPILVVWMANDINNMPKKLAGKVSEEIGKKVEEEWPAVTKAFIQGALLNIAVQEAKAHKAAMMGRVFLVVSLAVIAAAIAALIYVR